jgi:hypothetical protein
MMKKTTLRSNLAAVLFISATLAACGGGSGGNNASSPAAAAAVTYTYVPPKAGAQSVYADTLLDNKNNTINRTLAVSVTTTSAAGGYTTSEVDPSHSRIISGVVDHTFYPTVYSFDAMGRATNWTVTDASGSPVDCQVAGQQAAGAPSPLTAGQTWNVTYVEVCGAGPGLAFTQSGNFAGIEAIKVPAGTFNAYKFVSTTSRTVNGLTTTEAVTRWRDAASTGSRVLKSLATFTYGGAEPPQGALVSETQALQSYQ